MTHNLLLNSNTTRSRSGRRDHAVYAAHSIRNAASPALLAYLLPYVVVRVVLRTGDGHRLCYCCIQGHRVLDECTSTRHTVQSGLWSERSTRTISTHCSTQGQCLCAVASCPQFVLLTWLSTVCSCGPRHTWLDHVLYFYHSAVLRVRWVWRPMLLTTACTVSLMRVRSRTWTTRASASGHRANSAWNCPCQHGRTKQKKPRNYPQQTRVTSVVPESVPARLLP